MSRHLHREVAKIRSRILALGSVVEDTVRRAVDSVERRDGDLAARIIEEDYNIDMEEVAIEEECLKVLALYQPVAVDLRYLAALLKINNDLERIGDLAVNIAERTSFLASREVQSIPFDFLGMAEKARAMLRHSLDALVAMDARLAHQVRQADDEVDALDARMHEIVKASLRSRPEEADYLIHMLLVSRHLERIADHATNIAEDVIYMVEGEIVRHVPEDFSA